MLDGIQVHLQNLEADHASVQFRKLQKQQSKAEASKAARAPPQGTPRQESREVIVSPKHNKILLANTCILPD